MQLKNINMHIIFLPMLIFLGDVAFAENFRSKKLFPGNDKIHLTQAGNHRFEFINDIFNGSDDGVSNALSFQFYSPTSEKWQDIPNVPNLLTSFGAWLPGFSGDQFSKRISVSASQLIQTPTEIENPDPIANDVAYLGLLTFSTGFTAYNDNEFRGLNVVLGLTGEPTFAEQGQNFVHEGLGQGEVAQGWDHQVGTAPLLNIGAVYKKKFLRLGNPGKFSFDTSFSGEAKIGNMITEAGARLETRFGINMPRGFAPIPDPIGRFMQYDSRLSPLDTTAASIYATASLHTAAIAHIVLADGNLISSDPEIAGSLVDTEPFVGFLFLGLHYERASWAISFQHVTTSDFVEIDSASASGNSQNSFTSLRFEWRI